MRTLVFVPLLLTACLPTGTGNPLADAGGFDAGFADGGPGADAIGSDAGCSDAGPAACGVTGGASCDCLAGEPLALGEGRPRLLVDHPAQDGRSTLIASHFDLTTGDVVYESFVMADGIVEHRRPLPSVGPESGFFALAGDSIVFGQTVGRRELHLRRVDVTTGLSADEELVYTPPGLMNNVKLAHSDIGDGDTTAVAFSSQRAPGDSSLFVVLESGGTFAATEYPGSTNIRGVDITERDEGWLLAYATDDAVFTVLLDATGAAIRTTEIASVGFVPDVHLATSDTGFFLAFGGTAPAIHSLDENGLSTGERSMTGRFLALEWAADEGSLMAVRTDALLCVDEGDPLDFDRFDASLTPLHETVRVGVVDYAAAVTLVDGTPWVASSNGSTLSFANACVDD